MNKKYKLIKTDKTINGTPLFQIEALRDFGNVKKGDLGGYVEKENNLSHNGNAWVFGSARVYGDARVFGNAWVYGDARVFGSAWVSDNARVYGNAEVSDNARVYGDARVYGNAWASDNARVSDNAWVYGDARVSDNAWVYGDARVYGSAWVSGELKLSFGWCFERKRKDWNVAELENEGEILLIKDYKPPEEEMKTVTLELTDEQLEKIKEIINK